MKKLNFSTPYFLAVFLLTTASISLNAISSDNGADALLNAVGNLETTKNVNSNISSSQNGVDPSQAYIQWRIKTTLDRQVFTDFNAIQNPSFEMRQWMGYYFTEKYENFAHLWEVLKEKTPDSFRNSATAAYLFSLNQLSVPETFFHEWMTSLQNESFLLSKSSNALEETIYTNQFDQWLMNAEISVTETEKAFIQKIGIQRSPAFLSLNASLLRRKGIAALEFLPKLLANSPFRPLLAQTAVVSLAKKGDLALAAQTLKNYYEPFLKSEKDPKKLAIHYLEIARLLYQAGALEGAIEYYEKIPNGIPEYLTSREELTWCWLRTGNIQKLRGNLETLTSKVLEKEFQPEAYLVRAVSNLKLCYYSEVQKDFESFTKVNRHFAQSIDKELNAENVMKPRKIDIYTAASLRSVDRKREELSRVKSYAERSMSAVIPAVGIQKHWSDYTKKIEVSLLDAEKRVNEEYRRQWKNDKITLDEAIRKMQYVKVELLSQVTESISQNSSEKNSDTLSTQSSAALVAPKLEVDPKNKMIFPFDGVIWSDEFFKLQSVSKGQCIGQ